MGGGLSTIKSNRRSEVVEKSFSFHENLVRERDQKTDWESIYSIVEEIGHSGFGICSVYKIKKKEGTIYGPMHMDVSRRSSGRIRRLLSKPKVIKKSRSLSGTGSLPSSQPPLPITSEYPSTPPNKRTKTVGFKGDDYTSEEDEKPESMVFAMKMINLALVPDDRIDQLKNEVEILKTLDHKNIIKAFETFPVKADKRLPIIMELCTGGDLHARFPYTECQAADITKQILSAISYVHDRNIVHRDIKLENIVFESNRPDALIKVIDFGLSVKYSMDDPVLTERVGTLYSMSPETMQGIYTSKADMWSIGVCTYMLLAKGEKPFEGKTPKEVVAKVLSGKFDLNGPSWEKISAEGKDFIKSLLKVNPEDRVAARDAMFDPWFSTRATCHRKSISKLLIKERVLESIIHFADTGEFRKLALNVIAQKSTSDEIFEVRRVFDLFDTNDSGTISLDEFKAALSRFDYTDEQVERIFRKVDVNRNDQINYTEFLAAALEIQGNISEQRLAEAFNLMDCDGKGYITRKNLRHLLGKHSCEKYIDQLMAEASIFRDGRITYDEFRKLVTGTARPPSRNEEQEPNELVDSNKLLSSGPSQSDVSTVSKRQ